MSSKISRPSELANYIFSKLKEPEANYLGPNEEQLAKFFDVLFYVSLNTEEGDPIKVTVTIYPAIELEATRRKSTSRWRLVKFKDKIDFDIRTVTKLAKAADPQTTSLAAQFDRYGQIWIIGMIDQEMHLQNYLNFEISEKPESPGIMQASVTGVGKISVLKDYQLLASLNQYDLIKKNVDVLQSGVVNLLLKEYFQPVREQMARFIDSNFPDVSKLAWLRKTDKLMLNTLTRLLIQVRNYHHGGAILLTNIEDLDEDYLNVKHEISYNRLATSMLNFLKEDLREGVYGSEINKLYESSEETLDFSLHHHYSLAIEKKNNALDELRGAIRFVASQSCVDGLVLMDMRLRVKGFGAVIQKLTAPEKIFVSESVKALPNTLKEISSDVFGTRHRSMFAYCFKYSGSIGFVVSQDGDIRAVTRISSKLVVWENIKTQQFIKAI